jgi:hypothetical protein
MLGLFSSQVCDVDTGLVVKVLRPIWTTKTETATRLPGRIESIRRAAAMFATAIIHLVLSLVVPASLTVSGRERMP